MDQCSEPNFIGAREIPKQRGMGEMAKNTHIVLDILI